GGATTEFRLPALGEGIDAATVVGVLVKPGDAVQAGQNVIAVETDKASVEVPVETAGTVAEVHVKPGDKVPVGAPILTLTTGAAKPAAGPRPSPPPPPPPTAAPRAPAPAAKAPAPIPAASGNGPVTQTLIPAGPATRRLARELGVALAEVSGTS